MVFLSFLSFTLSISLSIPYISPSVLLLSSFCMCVLLFFFLPLWLELMCDSTLDSLFLSSFLPPSFLHSLSLCCLNPDGSSSGEEWRERLMEQYSRLWGQEFPSTDTALRYKRESFPFLGIYALKAVFLFFLFQPE